MDAQVALALAKWSLECLIEGRAMFGAHTGASHLCWDLHGLVGRQKACVSLCWAEMGWGPPVELRLLMEAVSHSPRMLRDAAMLHWVVGASWSCGSPGTPCLQLWYLLHLSPCVLSAAAKLKNTEPLPNVVCLGVQDAGYLCQQ